MEQDYIEIGGVRYRARFNWNALTGFLADTGQDSIDALNHFKVTPSGITVLVYHGLKEGERLDGREFTLSKEDIGANLNVPLVEKVMEIFMRHNGQSGVAAPSTAKKKMKLPSLRSGRLGE